MTMPKVQSSLVLFLVEVMRLMGMVPIMGLSVELKMSLSFFPSFTRLCCGMRKMCGINHKIHAGMGVTKLFCSFLFMVFMILLRFFAIKGLFSTVQY